MTGQNHPIRLLRGSSNINTQAFFKLHHCLLIITPHPIIISLALSCLHNLSRLSTRDLNLSSNRNRNRPGRPQFTWWRIINNV